jgi:hypothetical protein
MPYGERNITWLLITLLQERPLPWPTASLITAIIQADSRVSGYSPRRKKCWSDEQWFDFLDSFKRVEADCRFCVEAYRTDSDLHNLNMCLNKVHCALSELDVIRTPDEDNYVGKPCPDVRSISWLLRMFIYRTNAVHPTRLLINRLYAVDERAHGSRNKPVEDRHIVYVEEYDRLYQACEICTAAFFEDSDLAALNASLEKITDDLDALTLLQ